MSDTPVTLAEVELVGRVRTAPVPAGSGSRVLTSLAAGLVGWSLLESTGAAVATVKIYAGGSTTGELRAVVALAAGASSTQWLGLLGLPADAGLYLDVVSGSVEGAVYFRPEA